MIFYCIWKKRHPICTFIHRLDLENFGMAVVQENLTTAHIILARVARRNYVPITFVLVQVKISNRGLRYSTLQKAKINKNFN